MPAVSERDVVIIGYGNELCGDDVLGPQVAREVASCGLPGLRAIVEHQLMPEMAEHVAAARAVIFVDARIDGDHVRVEKVEPAHNWASMYHAPTPAALLALACAMYNGCPDAWCVTIPGKDFGLGDLPSVEGLHHLPEAVATVRRLAEEAGRVAVMPA